MSPNPMDGPSAELIASACPDRATIYTSDPERDEEGTVIDEGTAGASDIPAQLSSPESATELKTADGSFLVRRSRLILAGWHPEVDEGCRVVIGSRSFDVVGVVDDSFGASDNGWTVLQVEEREPLNGSGS